MMNWLDFLVLGSTLSFIAGFGIWKTREQRNAKSYLLGNNSMSWSTIGLSVMATQASAITFISTPGQGFESGMGFVQNYFGLPFAMIIIAVVFIPIYYRLKVYTAYEFLEQRFDLKTRLLGAILFLIQRGMAAGITIYAPAIILSTILGWDVNLTILFTGIVVIVYTVSGGTKAVSITHKQQMGVIMLGMFIVFGFIIYYLSEYVSFGEAWQLAGYLNKTQAVDFDLNVEKRYTFWSGITGGLFLALSYFGTDQSQVQRYLGGQSIKESRMGLMFNGIFKIPMQYFILMTGVMVYVFYVFAGSPVHFKSYDLQKAGDNPRVLELSQAYENVSALRKAAALDIFNQNEVDRDPYILQFQDLDKTANEIRKEIKTEIKASLPDAETKDTDYVFLTFILTYLPHGFIGLLIAVILSAAMSSTSSELNSLGATSSVDLYKRLFRPHVQDFQFVAMSRFLTLIWGIIAITFAFFAHNSENLIEAVNIIGSLFYGTILGIFLVAFFIKRANGNAVFIAAIIAQGVVLVCHWLTLQGKLQLGYLWYNAIGSGLTCLLAFLFSFIVTETSKKG